MTVAAGIAFGIGTAALIGLLFILRREGRKTPLLRPVFMMLGVCAFGLWLFSVYAAFIQ